MPIIKNNGDIHYGSEHDPIIRNQIRPIVDKVNEIVAAWEKASDVPFESISNYRILSEYNNYVLAARDDSKSEFGYGLQFVTWKYSPERTGFQFGYYTTDYDAAKEDFAARSGLIDHNKLFNETELTLIRQGLVHFGTNCLNLTHGQSTQLEKVIKKIEEIVPAIREHEELEAHSLVPDDGHGL
jgi:hypothetical protein